MQQMKTTQGPWIVGTTQIKSIPEQQRHICVGSANDQSKVIALTGYADAKDIDESIANAALIAIAPDMLDALIAIQESALANTLSADAISTMISEIFEKLANEAGVS